MRDFKFACPVCGQHIQSDSASAGSTMECPTCFRKLTVPQAPASDTSRLIISAALAETKKRPVPAGTQPAAESEKRTNTSLLVPAIVLVVVVVAVAAVVISLTSHSAGSAMDGEGVADAWTLDLSGKNIPEAKVSGSLRGRDFSLGQAIWKGTTLTLSQSNGARAEMELVITLPIKGGDQLAGRSFIVTTNQEPLPQPILLQWEDERAGLRRASFPAGYALQLELTTVNPQVVSGKMYLCLPDVKRSWLAGSFRAQVETLK